jgi:hypothetical protein
VARGARGALVAHRRAQALGQRHLRGHGAGLLDSHRRSAPRRLHARGRQRVWQVSPRFEAYLAIDNLTDQQYEEFVGFESRGIAPRAGVRFSF